jgi:sugar phosphate isomerase/epimerase
MSAKQEFPMKGRFPFRLGTTSYIIPDDVVPNIRYLADKVDDIELVLFESDEMSNIPDPDAVATLNRLAADNDLTYTVHLPLDTFLGSGDESVRRNSVEKHLRVIDRMSPLEPFAWVVHFEGDVRETTPSDNMPRWVDALRRSAAELTEHVAADLFAVEYIGYPFPHIESVLDEYGLSLTFDLGHMVLYDDPYAELMDKYLPRSKVVHIHGTIDGRDHKSLRAMPPDSLRALLSHLSADSRHERVVTIEVFGQDDFDDSLSVMERYL